MWEKFKNESYQLLGGINSKASPYINGPMEFRDLTNMNFFIPGALTKRQGTSLYLGATVSGRVTGGIEFERLNGASYVMVSANTNLYSVTNTWTAVRAGLLDSALFDFTPFVDRLFAANGQDFFKTDGVNSSLFSLPPGRLAGLSLIIADGGYSGVFVGAVGYLNDRGYYGPVGNGFTVVCHGVSFGRFTYHGLTTPAGYGISAIVLYLSSADGTDLFGITQIPVGYTSSFTVGLLGTSGLPFPLSTLASNDYLWFTLAPKYLEIYNNELFMAGFSGLPSSAYWSEVGEPEAVDPVYETEFRTNDGDRVTGMKAYNGSLIVTKGRSVHRISGEDPNAFLQQEITDQYGCISNRAMVVFRNKLWFLDSSGICEYDGARTEIISEKVDPIFRAMNLDAARENAVAFHFKDFSEVWFAIPINGSTVNNCIVVFDYEVNAWTKYEGLQISSLFLARGSLGLKTPFFGGYSGNLFYFGASFCGDNGSAITCMIDSYFLAAGGQTDERLYRRFYLNVNAVTGVTQPISVNFRTNYSATIGLTRTMYQNPFQSRIDFGLSARSIQASVHHVSASLPLTVFGYAFVSREQRNV